MASDSDKKARIDTCRHCNSPLIWTFAFSKFEYYCVNCGSKYGMFGAKSVEMTDELQDRYHELEDEWKENAEPYLISDGAYLNDCDKCAEPRQIHILHATEEELEAHEKALAWLKERAEKGKALAS